MSVTVLIWIVAAIILILIPVLFIGRILYRRKHFSPDRSGQSEHLNQLLKEAGFGYDPSTDVFFSLRDCWQREMGYCRLFDEGAGSFNMIMDCEPIHFSHRGKRWMIELWKGQYGITTGGEIGIYYTDRDDISVKDFSGPLYESVPDEEMLAMGFTLRKNGQVLFRRKDVHWWLTGFRLGEFSSPDELTMDAWIRFPDRSMRDAFLQGLTNAGYRKDEFSVRHHTVQIRFIRPHGPQPAMRGTIQEKLVQKTNRTNCRLYQRVTESCTNTPDKLAYLENLAPDLFEFCMHSLYARGFYEIYEGLKHLLPSRPRPPKPDDGCRPCPPKPDGGCRPCPPKPDGGCRPCPPKPDGGCRPCPPKPDGGCGPCPQRPGCGCQPGHPGSGCCICRPQEDFRHTWQCGMQDACKAPGHGASSSAFPCVLGGDCSDRNRAQLCRPQSGETVLSPSCECTPPGGCKRR